METSTTGSAKSTTKIRKESTLSVGSIKVAKPSNNASSISDMLSFYCSPLDTRYEDIIGTSSSTFNKVIFRDVQAGLVGAMVAIPMGMSFAVASGLRPAQGIVGGAIASLVAALFGGSKYQVYAPAATFVPVIHGILALSREGGPFYDPGSYSDDEMFRRGHGLLVFASMLSTIVMLALAVVRVGSVISKIPTCVFVGFLFGTAITVAFMFMDEALGIEGGNAYQSVWSKILHISGHIGEINFLSLAIALATLICVRSLMYVTVMIPGALIALLVATIVAHTILHERHLVTVGDKYGHIPQSLSFTPPHLHVGSFAALKGLLWLVYYALSIAVIGAVQSLLCARFADGLAVNRGTRFHPNKELWGQGLVNAVVPLFNSFPHVGGLDRTALSIQLGAVTPLAGIMQGVIALIIAFTCAHWLEMIPMAALAGLVWHASASMVTVSAISRVESVGGMPHVFVMCATALFVVATDLLLGFALGMMVYAAGFFTARYRTTGTLRSPRPGCADLEAVVFDDDDNESDGTEEEKEPIVKERAS